MHPLMVCACGFLGHLHRCPATQVLKWYKFDDGEVTEAKMDDEEVIQKALKITGV